MQTTDSQEIFDVLHNIFRKKKWLIIGAIMVVLVPIFIYNETASPIYEANTMLVSEEFDNPVPGYDYDVSREIRFSNQLVEIQSYSFALDIVRVLPREILDKFSIPDSTMSEEEQMDYIVSKIQKNISAFPVRGSNVVRISFQYKNPLVCKMVANAAAEVIQKRKSEIKQEGVAGLRAFIEGQLERYKGRLDSSESAMRTFKEQNRITSSIDREAEELMRRLTEAEVLYNAVKTDQGSAQNRLYALQNKLAEQKSTLIPSVTDLGSSWALKLKERLVELNLQYMNLKVQGYAEDHPKMLDLKTKMEQVRSDLTDKASKLAQSETSLDPLAQMEKFVQESVNLQIELESLKAREKALKSIIDGYNAKLGTMPTKEFALARLTREEEVNRKIYNMLKEKLEEARINEAEQYNTIRIIDKAQLPENPISPRKKLNLVIGVLLGLVLGIAIAFVTELRNNTVKSPSEIERLTQWPVVAMIPNIQDYAKGKFRKTPSGGNENSDTERTYRALFSSLEPNTPIAEAYRMLRTNLQFNGLGRDYKTLLVTSIAPGDGKTTTLTNLAVSFAAFGNKTLILDADLRIPVMHKFFGLEREMGVSDLLEALDDLDNMISQAKGREAETNRVFRQEVEEKLKVNVAALEDNNSMPEESAGVESASETSPIVEGSNGAPESEETSNLPLPVGNKTLKGLRDIFNDAIKNTGVPNLSFVSSGRKMQNPEGMISTRPMPVILQRFKHRFNTILIDSAPLLLVNDTLLLAGIVDAVLIVLDARKCDREMLLKAKKMMQSSKANVVGVVLNNYEVHGSYKNYYTSYYSEK